MKFSTNTLVLIAVFTLAIALILAVTVSLHAAVGWLAGVAAGTAILSVQKPLS